MCMSVYTCIRVCICHDMFVYAHAPCPCQHAAGLNSAVPACRRLMMIPSLLHETFPVTSSVRWLTDECAMDTHHLWRDVLLLQSNPVTCPNLTFVPQLGRLRSRTSTFSSLLHSIPVILARQRDARITRHSGSEAVGARCTLEELLAVAFEQMIVAPPRVLTLEDMKALIQGKSLFQTIACQDTPTPLHIVLHILGCMPTHCLYQGSIIYFWVLWAGACRLLCTPDR